MRSARSAMKRDSQILQFHPVLMQIDQGYLKRPASEMDREDFCRVLAAILPSLQPYEISMCWEGTSQSTLGAAYWYSNAEHKTDIDLGFDASQDFHTYEVDWSPTTIVWSVDGKALHTDNGKAKSTIPWEAMEFAIITRPRSQPYEGDAESQFKLFNFTSTYSGPRAA
jgi:hypothetical protein